jgi:hypothetical protein
LGRNRLAKAQVVGADRIEHSSLEENTMSQDGQNHRPRPQVVKMLTELLDQAKQGQITSVALVKFKPDGGVDCTCEFTEGSDLDRAPEHISRLKRSVLELVVRAAD